MEKIVVETVPILQPKEKVQFQIVIPENATRLIGISISSDMSQIAGGGLPKITHRGVGIIRLFIADNNDCFFSEMLHADYGFPKWENIGSMYNKATIWNHGDKPFTPLPIELSGCSTLIQGHFEDLVGYLKDEVEYNVRITLHFQISQR